MREKWRQAVGVFSVSVGHPMSRPPSFHRYSFEDEPMKTAIGEMGDRRLSSLIAVTSPINFPFHSRFHVSQALLTAS